MSNERHAEVDAVHERNRARLAEAEEAYQRLVGGIKRENRRIESLAAHEHGARYEAVREHNAHVVAAAETAWQNACDEVDARNSSLQPALRRANAAEGELRRISSFVEALGVAMGDVDGWKHRPVPDRVLATLLSEVAPTDGEESIWNDADMQELFGRS